MVYQESEFVELKSVVVEDIKKEIILKLRLGRPF